MNGIIFNIQRFAIHDGPGVRTSVFFKGCPLKCQWCHNPESLNPNIQVIQKQYQLNGKPIVCEESVGYEISSDDLMTELIKDELLMDESKGGITFSGGEPLLQHAFLEEMLHLCRNRKIHTAVDTSLFSSWEVVERITDLSDLLLVDLKMVEEELHKEYTGVSNLKILENIKKLALNNHSFRIRIPIIPGVSDQSEKFEESIKFLDGMRSSIVGIDLLPFHNIAKNKYEQFNMMNTFKDNKTMSVNSVESIRDMFQESGFETKIGG